MNEYEKDLMKLFDTHEKAEKCELIKRINWEIKIHDIGWHGKNEWVCKVTGSPMGTVCTWFSNAKCGAVNKIPLYALCQIAVALEISVWDFYKFINNVNEEKESEPKINRRDKLYWYLSILVICQELFEKDFNMHFGKKGNFNRPSALIF